MGKIKEHLKCNKKVYIAVGSTTIVVAGTTALIMRRCSSNPINHGTSVIAENGFSVLGKKVSLNNVSYFASGRQGPPSWVVRCVETDQVYTSQRSAAIAMDLSAAEISKHLNGLMDHVRGYHFERICMAA